ncbi:MAG: M20/M25/M40 family metallo-hydrolase [Planctomycetota bacterium]|nr:M20/M25/M40 family metallo-hydrolase [Planctomycetota bacterium]
MSKFSICFFSCCCLLGVGSQATGQYPGAIKPPMAWQDGFTSITDQQAKEWTTLLAGPKFKGRGTGQAGYLKASFFMAGKLAEYGFEPIGDNGTYFQNLPFSRMVPDPQRSALTLGELKVSGREIGFTRFSGSIEFAEEVAFVKGVGADARLGDVNAYRGKVIIVSSRNAKALARDVTIARPKAVLTVVDDQRPIKSLPMTNRGGGIRGGGPVFANISIQTAKKIAKAAGVSESLVVIDDQNPGAVTQQTEKKLSIKLNVIDQPMHNPNVVGWLEGSDPKLKHEHVIIGAHLDHLGTRGQEVFPGADDNASGSTAILQIAKALAINKVRPKRSILMMWFAAEEIGLVGSRHYANNPLKPLKDCICMLNIDMIGRNEEQEDEPASENEDTIHLIGTKRLSPKMHESLIEANQYVGYKFEYDEEDSVFRRSDQASFHDKGIPVAFVFGGFNPYYHQTTDTIRGINFSKISNCARLFFAASFIAAEHGHYVQR